MRRYQIAQRLKASANKWELRAHGARFNRAEALATVERSAALGYESRLLPLPKEESDA